MQPSIDPNFDLRIRSLDSNQTSRLLNQKSRLVVTQQLNLPHRNARASSTKGASLRQSLPHSLSHSPKNHDLLQSLARPKSALNRVPSNRMSISLVKYHSSYRFVSHPNRKGAIPQLKEKQRSEVGLIYRSMTDFSPEWCLMECLTSDLCAIKSFGQNPSVQACNFHPHSLLHQKQFE